VTPAEYACLVDAQESRDDCWSRIAHFINELDPENQTPRSGPTVRAYLMSLSEDEFQNLLYANIIDEIQKSCRTHGREIVIPASLKDKIGSSGPPDDPEEAKKYIPAKERLSLVSNPEPYELYLFRPLPDPLPLQPVPRFDDVRADFVKSLKQAEAYATKVASPFFEAFKLAAFVLETDEPALRNVRTDDIDEHVQKLASLGFSETAQDIFRSDLCRTGEFEMYAWPEERSRALLALSIADVFGGMGSWNDQALDDPEYSAVSSDLFRNLRRFYVAALNRV
jgi:hypothetical protein